MPTCLVPVLVCIEVLVEEFAGIILDTVDHGVLGWRSAATLSEARLLRYRTGIWLLVQCCRITSPSLTVPYLRLLRRLTKKLVGVLLPITVVVVGVRGLEVFEVHAGVHLCVTKQTSICVSSTDHYNQSF